MFNELKQPYFEEFEGGSGDFQEPTEPTQEPVEPTPIPGIKVKYNHEEIELPYEEAIAHIQKGMNYEKATERAKQEARDEQIAEMYGESHGIYTVEAYKEALKASQEAEKQAQAEEKIRAKYSYLDEEIIEEMIQGKKFREEFEQMKNETARERKERETQEIQAQAKEKDQMEFLTMWSKEQGRAWGEQDTLPQEVLDYLKNGKTLADSYARYLVDVYKSKANANETNQKNAVSSTGSVTGNGNPTEDFITAASFEANKSNQKWVIKNLTKINESRAKW